MELNRVEVTGLLQETTAKGAQAWKHFPEAGSKTEMLSFSLVVPDGSRSSYIRCVARGAIAADLLKRVGNTISVVGSLANVKIKENWITQVIVTSASPATSDGRNHDEQETRTKESVADLRAKQSKS